MTDPILPANRTDLSQLNSLFVDDDLRPDAIKFGMLAGAPTIEALATYFAAIPADKRPFLVLDPVMVSTSGHALLADGASAALVSRLLPLVHLVTPNVPEAIALSGFERNVTTLEDMLELAARLRADTGAAVLLKGGHVPLRRSDVVAAAKERDLSLAWDEDEDGAEVQVLADFRATLGLDASPEVVVDMLFDDDVQLFVGKKVESSSTHGTGCTLSAALASVYAEEVVRARGIALSSEGKGKERRISREGARRAISYTQGAIASAHPLGRGHGPLNHYHMTMPRALPP